MDKQHIAELKEMIRKRNRRNQWSRFLSNSVHDTAFLWTHAEYAIDA